LAHDLIFDIRGFPRERTRRTTTVAGRSPHVRPFQYEGEARKTLADLKERFGRFGLALNEDKTRLIRFGRFAVSGSRKDGFRRPQTFGFLGFRHYCATLRNGTFTVQRKTITKRLIGKLQALRWK
jgi:RNA-directed DNA polymerase